VLTQTNTYALKMAGGNEHEKENNKTFTDILAMHMAFIHSAICHSCCFP